MSHLKLNRIILQIIPSSMLVFGLAACSTYNSDWPSLTDAPEGATERERVIEKIEVPPYETRSNTAITTADAARARLTALEKDIAADRANFEQKLQSFAALGDDTKTDAWFALQVALTRLSHTVSQLDSLVHLNVSNQATGFDDITETAIKRKTELDAIVVAARQKLIQLDPR